MISMRAVDDDVSSWVNRRLIFSAAPGESSKTAALEKLLRRAALSHAWLLPPEVTLRSSTSDARRSLASAKHPHPPTQLPPLSAPIPSAATPSLSPPTRHLAWNLAAVEPSSLCRGRSGTGLWRRCGVGLGIHHDHAGVLVILERKKDRSRVTIGFTKHKSWGRTTSGTRTPAQKPPACRARVDRD